MIGTPVETYVSDGTKEASEITSADRPFIATRANLNGTPYVDENGHTNSWTIDEKTLNKRYDMEHVTEDGFAKPKGEPQPFIHVPGNVALMETWGENGEMVPQLINAGGFITTPGDIDSPEKFNDALYGMLDLSGVEFESLEEFKKRLLKERIDEAVKKIQNNPRPTENDGEKTGKRGENER